MAERVGVLLLNLGGPDRPQNVRPFLLNLFRDPDVLAVPGGAPVRYALAWLIATLRAPKVEQIYQTIGGSPLLPRTRAQERVLERRLNELAIEGGLSRRYHVRTAMRYWAPRADLAVAELNDCGVDRFVALPLYPHACGATTGSSMKELRKVLARMAPEKPLDVVVSYARDARYLTALTRCVEEGLVRAHAASDAPATLLFSAHGLPQRIVDSGDPYVDEIRATIAGVMARLPKFQGESLLSFQSRAGPVRWLAPTTESTIDRLAAAGCKSLVVVPVSFVSDHVETVYEVDLLFGKRARAAGIPTFVRTPALDVRADFIDALARLVVAHVDTPKRHDARAHAPPTH